MKLSKISNLYGGVVINDGEFESFGFLNSDAGAKLLVYYDDVRFKNQLTNSSISCIISRKELMSDIPRNIEGVVLSENPGETYWKIYNEYGNIGRKNFKTVIGEGCKISPKASIAEENVVIGNNCIIEDFACIKANTVLGNNVIVRCNAVIGSPGLQAKRINGRILPIKHFGGVIIEDYVEIYEFVTVEQAVFSWDDTFIGEQTMINSFSLIGHGSHIGKRCLLASFISMGGTSRVGNDVWLGPNSILKNQVDIKDRAQIIMGSTVRKSINEGEVVVGERIMSEEKYQKMQMLTIR